MNATTEAEIPILDEADLVRGWNAAAEIAGRNASTLRRMVDRGELDALKSPDGIYEFRRSHLQALRPGPEDASLVGKVMAELEKATPLVEILLRHRLSVETLEGIHRQWRQLKALEAGGTADADLADRVAELAQRLAAIEGRSALDQLAGDFACAGCATHGSVAVRVVCTACEREDWYGFWGASPDGQS